MQVKEVIISKKKRLIRQTTDLSKRVQKLDKVDEKISRGWEKHSQGG